MQNSTTDSQHADKQSDCGGTEVKSLSASQIEFARVLGRAIAEKWRGSPHCKGEAALATIIPNSQPNFSEV